MLDNILNFIATKQLLCWGILALVIVAFIIHPALGMIALVGAVAYMVIAGEPDDEDDLDGGKVDDSDGMKLPPV